jgi:4'-phosphopantetheinyl transferase
MTDPFIGMYYSQALVLKSEMNSAWAELCLGLVPLTELKNHAPHFLHPKELAYLATLTFEKRQASYLLGRFLAKLAVTKQTDIPLHEIFIDFGIFQYPVVYHAGNEKIQVSISHCNQYGIALAFPETHPLGVDLEIIAPDKNSIIETQLTGEEKYLLATLHHSTSSTAELYTLFWTIKEALSKTLRTGLMSPVEIYAIKSVKKENHYWLSEFKNFGQYQALSFPLRPFICSIVYPKNMQMLIDISAIERWATKQGNL